MPPVLSSYGSLAAAILFEIAGTTFLQRSQQFTQLGSTLAMALCYAGAFFFLSLALRSLSLGVAYAIWSGVGIVLTAAIGSIVFKQALDGPALMGIGLIVSGVVVMQGLSNTTGH